MTLSPEKVLVSSLGIASLRVLKFPVRLKNWKLHMMLFLLNRLEELKQHMMLFWLRSS